MTGPVETDLRLALAMRGGVSLSIWIGGAVREIDQVRRDLHAIVQGVPDGGEPPLSGNALADLAHVLGRRSVTVDVLTGASAGGLNAVVLATAMVAGNSVDQLRDVWLEAADFERLLHTSSGATQLSMLDGDFFLAELKRRLTVIGAPPPALVDRRQTPPVDRLDVLLSVTSVAPTTTTTFVDPLLPTSEQRIDGVIRYRHRTGDGNRLAYSDFPGTDGNSARQVVDLALGARSTASFPVAFEPVDVSGRLHGQLELRPERPDRVVLYDGGVVDNMPVGKAVRAIESAPAGAPTERVLLYLHPSPRVRATSDPADDDVPGSRPIDVLTSAVKAFRVKSLNEDLEELDRHNGALASMRHERDRLLRDFQPDAVPALLAADRAALDAERIVSLLVSPWEHVEAALPPTSRRAPLKGCTPTERGRVQQAIRDYLAGRPPSTDDWIPSLSQGSPRPWGAVIRTASLLIEWAHVLEQAGGEAGVSALKEELHAIRDRAFTAAAQLGAGTLETTLAPVGVDLGKWATEVMGRRLAVVDGALRPVQDAWERTCAIGTLLGARSVGVRFEQDGIDGLRSVMAAMPSSVGAAYTVEAGIVLDAVDRALLPLHRNTPQGSLESIRFLTLSGQARTPLGPNFNWPEGVGGPALLRTLLPQPGRPADTGLVDPSSKLAGNQLNNFAAFLLPEWRANDWMWGQIDASTTLVDVLIPSGSPAPASLDLAALERICTAPFPRGPRSPHPDGWADELEALAQRQWDALRPKVTEELTGESALREDSAVRAAVLWRRHLEIAGAELGRAVPNPLGTDPPPTFDQAVEAWSSAPRRLMDRWGERRTTALGMRAAFVGWRAFFAQVGGPLAWVRGLLAPVFAPLVGLVLARRRSIFVLETILAGIVAPRVASSTGGAILVGVVVVATLIAGLAVTRPPSPAATDLAGGDDVPVRRPWGLSEPWTVASVVAAVGALVVLWAANRGASWMSGLLPPQPDRTQSLDRYLLPGGSIAVVIWVSWFWARWTWRAVVTVLSCSVVVAWTWLGGHPGELSSDWWGRLLGAFASMWFSLAVVVFLTTLLGYNVDVADTRLSPPQRWRVWARRSAVSDRA